MYLQVSKFSSSLSGCYYQSFYPPARMMVRRHVAAQQFQNDLYLNGPNTFFLLHKNSRSIYVFGLSVLNGSWSSLSLWKNDSNWDKLTFLFWCIRDYFKNPQYPTTLQSRIILQRKGHVAWLQFSTKAPAILHPLIHDIHQLAHHVSGIYYGGNISHNLLRQVLEFLPHSYLQFGTHVTFYFYYLVLAL